MSSDTLFFLIRANNGVSMKTLLCWNVNTIGSYFHLIFFSILCVEVVNIN